MSGRSLTELEELRKKPQYLMNALIQEQELRVSGDERRRRGFKWDCTVRMPGAKRTFETNGLVVSDRDEVTY